MEQVGHSCRMARRGVFHSYSLRVLALALVLAVGLAFVSSSVAAAKGNVGDILARTLLSYMTMRSASFRAKVTLLDPYNENFPLNLDWSCAWDAEAQLARVEIGPELLGTGSYMAFISAADAEEEVVYFYDPIANELRIMPMGEKGMMDFMNSKEFWDLPIWDLWPAAGGKVEVEPSEFAYGFRMRALGVDTFEGRECCVISMKNELVTIDGEEITWDIRFWVALDDFMVVKIEGLTEEGKKLLDVTVTGYSVNVGLTREQLLSFPEGANIVDLREKK